MNENFARPYADLKTPFTVDKNGAFAEYIIQEPDSMPDLALGATIIIKDIDFKGLHYISGQVVGLRAISPFSPERENLLYIEPERIDPTLVLDDVTGPHTHQPMIIRISLDKEMRARESDGRSFSMLPIQRPPSARSRMFFPDIVANGNEAPSLREILNIKANGVCLGNVGFGNYPYQRGNDFLSYHWDVDRLDNKHIFIVGESGSGKTVFLKNLAYELRKHNSKNRVIMTDVQGDIFQLVFPDITKILEEGGWQEGTRTENAYDVNQTLRDFQIIIPARLEGTSANSQAIKKLAKNRGATVREIGLRFRDVAYPSDLEYLFKTNSSQVAMLFDEEVEYIRSKRSNQELTLENLKLTIEQLMNKDSNSQIRSHGGTTYLRSTYGAALRSIKALSSHFDFFKPSLETGSNPLDFFEFDGTTILYLDELDYDERIMWEMQLVKWLYENKKESWNCYVFFDEAHQIIPAKPSGVGAQGTFERLKSNFERLAREGRKFGINLILSTQSPKDLHPIVPEQCPTKIVMKINPRNAKYADLDDNLANIASSFGHGQLWITSPFNGTPNWVRIHSLAPAIPHEPMTTFWHKFLQAARDEK